MAANTNPIFAEAGIIGIAATVITAVTTLDGDLSGADVKTILTGGADGTYVQKLRVKPLGSNIQSVLRIFINNGGNAATAANNSLFDELALPSTTASNNSPLPTYDIPMNIIVPNGYKILASVGTTIASGVKVTAIAGDY